MNLAGTRVGTGIGVTECMERTVNLLYNSRSNLVPVMDVLPMETLSFCSGTSVFFCFA